MGMVLGYMGGIEEPAYNVSLNRHVAALPYEIREYGKRYAIETSYDAGYTSPSFMRLAGFIGVGSDPRNDGGQAIAMTAPVTMQQNHRSPGGQRIAMTAPVVMEREGASGSRRKMQFILPSEFDSMDKIPQPTDPQVRVVELPPSRGAVHRYSGSSGLADQQEKAKMLAAQLRSDGLDAMDDTRAVDTHQFWGFNPPFTLPWFRRNEIWIELSDEDVTTLREVQTTCSM